MRGVSGFTGQAAAATESASGKFGILFSEIENLIQATVGWTLSTDGAKGALDDSIQAASGIAMLNEMVLGEPRYLPTVIADKTTAMAVVYAVTAALYHRERTGVGQEIEVPMYEQMVYHLMTNVKK